jgi:hypothetical protein
MDYNEHRLHDQIKNNILNDDLGEEYKKFLLNTKKRSRFRIALIVIASVVVSAVGYNFSKFALFDSFSSAMVTVSTIAAILGFVTLSYLEPSGSKRKNSDSSSSSEELKAYFDRQLFELRLLIHSQQKSEAQNFSDADKERVIGNIQAKLESEALGDYISGIKQILAGKSKEEVLESQFNNITRRLSTEVNDLAKRGNLNLFLGIMTTLIGLCALGYSVFYSPETHAPEELLVYFVPRVSLVLLIEIFAYFFLRLYKQSLSEIKYFQNEITNIESRQLAVSITSNDKNPELMSRIVENLSCTERNFILNKDQTTVELERERLSGNANASVLSALKDVLINKK